MVESLALHPTAGGLSQSTCLDTWSFVEQLHHSGQDRLLRGLRFEQRQSSDGAYPSHCNRTQTRQRLPQ